MMSVTKKPNRPVAKKKEKPTRYKYHYLMRMPMTEAVTTEQGGEWIAFDQFPGGNVHAVRFVGGHVWDSRNGWRNTPASSTAGRGLTCEQSDEIRDAPKSYKRVYEVDGYEDAARRSNELAGPILGKTMFHAQEIDSWLDACP